MLGYHEDQYTRHTEAARFVGGNGGELPKRWAEIDNNYEVYKYRTVDPKFDLARAVIEGKDEATLNRLTYDVISATIADLQGTVRGQAGGTASAEIENHVRQQVAAELMKVYAPVADPNVKAVGTAFSKLWAEFLTLAKTVDPETTAESLVGKPQDQQTSWLRQLEVAKELDKQLRVLRAAVQLAGGGLRSSNNDDLVGLILPTDGIGQDRRAVWKAFDAQGRTGRWAALAASGLEVKPIESAKQWREYGRPTHLNKVVQSAWGGMEQFLVDGETGHRI